MPTFKHPCPYCGKFIDKAVRACPFCGQQDPFAPKRCRNCHRIVEDPDWVTCPSCGQSLIAPPPGTVPAGTAAPNAAGVAAAAPAGAPAAATAAAAPMKDANGNEIEPPPPPRPPLYVEPDAPAAPVLSGGPCSGCGAPLPAGARFCTVCGTMAS